MPSKTATHGLPQLPSRITLKKRKMLRLCHGYQLLAEWRRRGLRSARRWALDARVSERSCGWSCEDRCEAREQEGCFKASTSPPSSPPLPTSTFASNKYVFLSLRQTFSSPLTKQEEAAPLMRTQFSWLLKWNLLGGTSHAGNSLLGNKTATYAPVCKAKRTPNISTTFPSCRCNPVYSKFVLNHNSSPVPVSKQEFPWLKIVTLSRHIPWQPPRATMLPLHPRAPQHPTAQNQPSSTPQHRRRQLPGLQRERSLPARAGYVAEDVCTHKQGPIGVRTRGLLWSPTKSIGWFRFASTGSGSAVRQTDQ